MREAKLEGVEAGSNHASATKCRAFQLKMFTLLGTTVRFSNCKGDPWPRVPPKNVWPYTRTASTCTAWEDNFIRAVYCLLLLLLWNLSFINLLFTAFIGRGNCVAHDPWRTIWQAASPACQKISNRLPCELQVRKTLWLIDFKRLRFVWGMLQSTQSVAYKARSCRLKPVIYWD